MSSIDARFIKAGRLAEQISHDFTSLLVPLKSYPALLKSKLPKDNECLEYCDTMEKIAHRLMQMNDQLLALMSFNRQDNVVFDVNMILIEAKNLVKDYFKDEFIVESDVPKERFNVSGRPEQLYRVFFNLFVNAKDATAEKEGKISIKSEKVTLEDTRELAKDSFFKGECGDYARISVSDNGSGIAAENLNKIFDPFYTTKRETKKKSSGLGLAIVKDIVRDHNGFIEVVSKIDEGTTFSLFLPIRATS